jgi:hypothetical protein
MSTTVEFSSGAAGVGRLTFTSPRGVNVISTPFLNELDARLAAIERDPAIRVVIVSFVGSAVRTMFPQGAPARTVTVYRLAGAFTSDSWSFAGNICF